MANGTTPSGTTTTSTASTSTQTPATISLDVPSGVGDSPALQVAPAADTVLTGGDDTDVLVGGNGNDNLTGGGGDDILIGGGGTNTHEGGGGEDIFGHAAGATDTVLDFSIEDDKLSVAPGLTVTSTEQGTASAGQAAQIITFSDGSTLELVGVTQEFSSDWLVGSASS